MNRAIGTALALSALLLSVGVSTTTGCDSSPATSTGSGGAGGGAAGGATSEGGAGGTAAGAGGAGGAATLPFMAVNPCNSEDAYTTAGSTIAYGGSELKYTPKCLKVAAGSQVTFVPATTSDSFSGHPLMHSMRGTLPSPITETTTGAMKTFTFATPGFYAYYCEFHGSADDGNFMAGVIWVQ